MIVYRIEHIDSGLGMFKARDTYGILLLEKHSKKKEILSRHNYPGLWNDDELMCIINSEAIENTKDYYFAFNSIERILELFKLNELEELIYLGFEVYKVEVDKYIQSQYQTIFKKTEIIEQINVTHLFKNEKIY